MSRLPSFVISSTNADKIAEIRAILGAEFELLQRPPDVAEVEETGGTLLENAQLKARALWSATGLPTIADDTGLEVAALDGAPGVYSARYAGENATYADNVAKLLGALAEVGDRRAQFRTVAIARLSSGVEIVAEGVVTGTIAAAPRGMGGFGYDPLFVPDEGHGRTFSEMTGDEKHAISHRGRAFRELAVRLFATKDVSVH